MNWTAKAKVQNLVAALPLFIGEPLYFWIQQRFGTIDSTDPALILNASSKMARKIEGLGHRLSEIHVMEIGTGRRLNMPIGLWLAGVQQVTTLDLHLYLKPELVLNDLAYIQANEQKIREMFGNFQGFSERYSRVQELDTDRLSESALLDFFGVTYESPADAASTNMADNCIDVQISYTVLEHIPVAVLERIFAEGDRLLKPGGHSIHRIDLSDHFSHSDSDITPINFLEYSNSEWDKIAGNRFMYMNRLRMDDFLRFYAQQQHQILECETDIDKELLAKLESNQVKLHEDFTKKDLETLATVDCWVTSKPKNQ